MAKTIVLAFLFLVLGIIVVRTTFYSLQTTRVSADALHVIDAQMVPQQQDLPTSGSRTVSILLKPRNPSHNITAFILSLKAEGGINISSVEQPTTITGDDIVLLEPFSFVSTQSALMASRIDTTSVPSLKFNVTVKRNSTGLSYGRLSINTVSGNTYDMYSYESQTFWGNYDPVNGQIEDYDWGSTDNADFIEGLVVSPTTTPSLDPTLNPTAVPTTSVSVSPGQPTPTVGQGTIAPTKFLTPFPTDLPQKCGTLPKATNLAPQGVFVMPQAGQKLTWDPVAGADFYVVEVWQEQPGKVIQYTKVFSGPTYTNSYTYAKFVPEKKYIWKVYAINTCGDLGEAADAMVYMVGTQPTPELTYIPTASPTPAVAPVTITMRLRFQGIYTQPQNPLGSIRTPYVFLVWIRNADRDNPIYKWVTAKYDGIGSWILKDTFNLYPSDGYKVYIKGEKHLQRKICDGKPSDSEAAWYHCASDNGQIVIHPGENYFDFSNIILFAGDIPFKGEGDGILDAYDLSYIATHFGDTKSTIADLNFDGITDSQDFVIAARAIRVQKYDESYPNKIHPFFRKVPLHPEFP